MSKEYYDYVVSPIEERVISEHFEEYINDNDIDTSGWSQPEADFQYELFRMGWVMCLVYIDKVLNWRKKIGL